MSENLVSRHIKVFGQEPKDRPAFCFVGLGDVLNGRGAKEGLSCPVFPRQPEGMLGRVVGSPFLELVGFKEPITGSTVAAGNTLVVGVVV